MARTDRYTGDDQPRCTICKEPSPSSTTVIHVVNGKPHPCPVLVDIGELDEWPSDPEAVEPHAFVAPEGVDWCSACGWHRRASFHAGVANRT